MVVAAASAELSVIKDSLAPGLTTATQVRMVSLSVILSGEMVRVLLNTLIVLNVVGEIVILLLLSFVNNCVSLSLYQDT